MLSWGAGLGLYLKDEKLVCHYFGSDERVSVKGPIPSGCLHRGPREDRVVDGQTTSILLRLKKE